MAYSGDEAVPSKSPQDSLGEPKTPSGGPTDLMRTQKTLGKPGEPGKTQKLPGNNGRSKESP
jgi:hypothetical protein